MTPPLRVTVLMLLSLAACNLNPQPLPPDQATDATVSNDNPGAESDASSDGSFGGDVVTPPPPPAAASDAGTDADADVSAGDAADSGDDSDADASEEGD